MIRFYIHEYLEERQKKYLEERQKKYLEERQKKYLEERKEERILITIGRMESMLSTKVDGLISPTDLKEIQSKTSGKERVEVDQLLANFTKLDIRFDPNGPPDGLISGADIDRDKVKAPEQQIEKNGEETKQIVDPNRDTVTTQIPSLIPPEINTSLEKIASDATGAKLVNEAKRLGVEFTVEKMPSLNTSPPSLAMSYTQFVGDKTKIAVEDPNNIKSLVFSLVQAVSKDDGRSKEEVGIAEVIGQQVARNVGAPTGGITGTDQEIYRKKIEYYPTYQQTNDIRKTLANLGINVNV